MSRLAWAGLILAGLILGAQAARAPNAWAGPATVLGLPLPPGARVVAPGQIDSRFTSSRGFRKTIDFYEKHLRSRGMAHRAVPVYGYRGTVVARYLSLHPSTRWSAIHVYKSRGVTTIYIVPRAP